MTQANSRKMNAAVDLTWLDDCSKGVNRKVVAMLASLSSDRCGLLPSDGLLLAELAGTLKEAAVLERFAAECDAVGDQAGYCRANKQLQSGRRLITGIALKLRVGHREATAALVAEEAAAVGRGGSYAEQDLRRTKGGADGGETPAPPCPRPQAARTAANLPPAAQGTNHAAEQAN